MSQARILIVEDETIVARDIAERLARQGYEPAGAAHLGEDVVAQAEALRPDLVLMDVRLKGSVDGIAAAAQVRERLGIPVVFLTALADDATLDRAKVVEPFGYIVKPFQDSELRSTIEMALYKSRMERQLRASEERYRSLVEDQVELVCRFKPDGTLLFANRGFRSFFGLAEPIVEGTAWQSGTHPDDLSMVQQRIATLSPENPVVLVTNRVYDAHKAIRWVQYSNRAFFDAQGVIQEIQSVGRDITDSKQAADRLRRQNAELNLTNELMVDRELRMIELKQEVDALLRQAGRPPRYGREADF